MIRSATDSDIPVIAELGARFFDEAGWADVASWDDASIKATLAHLIAADDGIVIVAECDGEVVGMAGGMVYPHYFNHAQLTGQELFWWVDPAHRGIVGRPLMLALEREAKSRGAHSWGMIALDRVRPEAVGKIYLRHGYRTAEHSYVKVL